MDLQQITSDGLRAAQQGLKYDNPYDKTINYDAWYWFKTGYEMFFAGIDY